MYISKEFLGQKIKELRKKNKLSQSELAEKVDMSDKHLGRLESGKYYPTLLNFLNLLEVFNVDLPDFGLNLQKNENKYKDELIRLICLSKDEEAKLYLDLIKVLKNKDNLYY